MFELINQVEVSSAESLTGASVDLYKMAIKCNFGQRQTKAQIAAACCFLVCRRENQPILLKDISELMKIDLRILRSTYIKLSKLFRIEEQPFHQSHFNPNYDIIRILRKLNCGNTKKEFSKTCLEFVDYFKKKWFHAGRYPDGIGIIAYRLGSLMHWTIKKQALGPCKGYTGEKTFYGRILEFLYSDSSLLTTEQHKLAMAEYIRSSHKIVGIQKLNYYKNKYRERRKSETVLTFIDVSIPCLTDTNQRLGPICPVKRYFGSRTRKKIRLKMYNKVQPQKNNIVFSKRSQLNMLVKCRILSSDQPLHSVNNNIVTVCENEQEDVHFLSNKAFFPVNILIEKQQNRLQNKQWKKYSDILSEFVGSQT